VVRGFLCSGRHRAFWGDHSFLFRLSLHRRAASGRDLLRGEGQPQAHHRGRSLLWDLRGFPKDFEGTENHRRWLECYGAEIVHPPKRNSKMPWSKRLRQWVASLRQIVETVYDKLFNAFGLWRERPHEMGSLRPCLAARVALHNFCI
jgi:hypothetical protein